MTMKRRGSRRKTIWDDTLISSTVASGAQTLLPLSGALGDDSVGYTILRALVHIQFMHEGVPANDGVQALTYGIGVASIEAFAAGIVADPGTQGDHPPRDWYLRDRCTVMQDAAQVLQPTICRFDLRARRTLEHGTAWIAFDSAPVFGTAFTVRILGSVRLLVAIP